MFMTKAPQAPAEMADVPDFIKSTRALLMTILEGLPATQEDRSGNHCLTKALPLMATSKDFKRILQLRASRRTARTGQFLDWPAWDILLDLAGVQHGSEQHPSVSAVCVSSGAPQSTALRKLAALERAKLIRRYAHEQDRRRICVVLTEAGCQLVYETLREEILFYMQLAQRHA